MLDTLRKDLLNLTLGNTLLKMREFRAKGLTILAGDSEEVFQKLVEESKKYAFLPEGSKVSAAKTAGFLQTAYPEQELEKRLANTYSEARSFIEERGINALYISLGALKWYEADHSDTPILSPLLLVPVQFVRSVVNGLTTYHLQYNDEGIEPNYTLERKMAVDFGIQLPAYEEDNSIGAYFNSIADAIANKPNWEVLPNEIRVNLFAFLKLMMYHDLDDARWAENGKPSENVVIKTLLNDYGNLQLSDDYDAAGEPFQMDALPIGEIDHILDADSSQAQAIDQVFKTRYLVIKGPPGTGKSQTIANIIASCIQKGKTVLFVSEKLAALEVVEKRLEQAGLGAACLELHSYKANRKEILESIRQTLALKTQQQVVDHGELVRLAESRKLLNDYYASLLHPIGDSGVTPFQAIGEILQTKQTYPDIAFLPVANPKWTQAEIGQCGDLVKAACDFIAQHGQPRFSPFYGVGSPPLGLIEEENIKTETRTLKSALPQIQLLSENLAQALGLAVPVRVQALKQLLQTAQYLLENPGISGIHPDFDAQQIQASDIQQLFALGREYHQLKRDYADKLLPEAHLLNFHIVRQIYATKGKSWFRFLSTDFREAQKQLFRVLKNIPDTIAEQAQLVEVLVRKADLIESAAGLSRVARAIFADGAHWDFEKDDGWLQKQSGVEYLLQLHVKRAQGIVDPAIFSKLAIPAENFAGATGALQSGWAAYVSALQKWFSLLSYDPVLQVQRWGDDQALAYLDQRVGEMLDRFELLHVYCQWNAYQSQLTQLGCQRMVQELLGADAPDTQRAFAGWRFSLMTALLDEAMATRPTLNLAQPGRQADSFQETDRYLIESYNRLKIRFAHLGRIPGIDTPGIPMGVLRNELSKQRRHLPLRKLMEQAGEMIVQIKPVFMMSPLSVAHYLKPDHIRFDYVLFDEASQVKPVEAFGALLRADNIVVVGDDKQLPPSDFFNQVVDLEELDAENESSVVSDMESILDLFVTKNARQAMLQWHYRSKHESLIAVSNEYFYDARLINLPSAFAQSESLGLQFRHHPDTVYAAQKNEMEAGYIVEALKEHARLFPDPEVCSLGIAAFSIRQKDCIENLLMKVRREDSDFDAYLSRAEQAKEPFFVKNLENVQGDERDVIFVSICYGRTGEGKLSKNFGPVNRTGGERRLNVLFTRARLKCVLFSNITAADLPVTETDPRGLLVFKAFLDYAQNRQMRVAVPSQKPVDSPFEGQVKAALEGAGYVVHTQIGTGGYYVDLAIPDPLVKGRYLLGIECDGAAYHRSHAARERDRLRQLVLEGLGWQMYRIWSTDWFRQPSLELKKLLDHIEVLKNGGRIAEKPVGVLAPGLEKKKDEGPVWKVAYEQADVNLYGLKPELHLVEDFKLVYLVSHYVRVEAPVHVDYVKSVITQQLGIGRIGTRIEAKFQSVFAMGIRMGEWAQRGAFLWRVDQSLEAVRDRSALPDKWRVIEWVAPEEIRLAMVNIAASARLIDRVELMKVTLQALTGGTRLTEGIRVLLEVQADYLVVEGVLEEREGCLKIKN